MTGQRVRVLCGWIAALLLVASLGGCLAPRSEDTSHWRLVRWNGESAWASDSGDWRAIVSVERARLIYLGPKSGETNLLYAPLLPQEYFRQRGGHIVWLGPQSDWNAQWGTWPPPAEWEQRAAASLRTEGPRLSLALPRPDITRPLLKRGYHWERETFLCEVSWSGGVDDHQAIQILQLPLEATVEARRQAGAAPGFVRFDTQGRQRFEPVVLGAETSLLSDDVVRLVATETPAKFGFRPHTLKARIDAYELELARGESHGLTLDSPDRGFETQVFLGNAAYPFVEIEQLTPRLKTRDDEDNRFTVRITLRRLSTGS